MHRGRVVVQTFGGNLDIEASTAADVKAFIEETEGVPASSQVLISGASILDDDDVLADTTGRLQLALDIDGGKKKKRKKKVFTSKKRVPHERKKEKLKILKLFSVGKDGDVKELRQRCPVCTGSFLAKHKDGRLYCGNCHTNPEQ